MSLLTKKQPVDIGLRERAMNVGSTAAHHAVPLARTAGTSMKQGTDSAITWATPYVGAARHWAAPRLEQSALALSENIAPMIADALITAAHKIDYEEPKKRRITRNGVFTGSMLVVAACCAAAYAVLHRQETAAGFDAAAAMSDASEPGQGPDAARSGYTNPDSGRPDTGEGGQPVS